MTIRDSITSNFQANTNSNMNSSTWKSLAISRKITPINSNTGPSNGKVSNSNSTTNNGSLFSLPPKPPTTKPSHFPANCVMSSTETLLVAQSGDILVSRCRDSSLLPQDDVHIYPSPSASINCSNSCGGEGIKSVRSDASSNTSNLSHTSLPNSCCMDGEDVVAYMINHTKDLSMGYCDGELELIPKSSKLLLTPKFNHTSQPQKSPAINETTSKNQSHHKSEFENTSAGGCSVTPDEGRDQHLQQNSLLGGSSMDGAIEPESPSALYITADEYKKSEDSEDVLMRERASSSDSSDKFLIMKQRRTLPSPSGNVFDIEKLRRSNSTGTASIIRDPTEITPLPSFQYDDDINNDSNIDLSDSRHSFTRITPNQSNAFLGNEEILPKSSRSFTSMRTRHSYNEDSNKLILNAGIDVNRRGDSPYSSPYTKIRSVSFPFSSHEQSGINNPDDDSLPTPSIQLHRAHRESSGKSNNITSQQSIITSSPQQESNPEYSLSLPVRSSCTQTPPCQLHQRENPIFHGIPVFLRSLSSIRIARVSAHPLGSHALLISHEAMLFSYGSNDHGQLGLGRKTPLELSPQIVTPLLENGGKSIFCAAGVTHSFVVVKTEGKRLERWNSNNTTTNTNSSYNYSNGVKYSSDVKNKLKKERSRNKSSTPVNRGESNGFFGNNGGALCHHQVYGFGQNDCLKLGLVNPNRENPFEDVVVPRRVGLHAMVWQVDDQDVHSDIGVGTNYNSNKSVKNNVWEEQDINGEYSNNNNFCGTSSSWSKSGILEVMASIDHSMALVKKSNGVIELYAWGNPEYGKLGITPPNGEYVGLPTVVSHLSYQPSSLRGLQAGRNNISDNRLQHHQHGIGLAPKPYQLRSNPYPDDIYQDDYPVQIGLGLECTMILTFKGRVFSFGKSADGLLGLGENVTNTTSEMEDNTEIAVNSQPQMLRFPRSSISSSAALVGSRSTIVGASNNINSGGGNTSENLTIASLSVGARHAVAVTHEGRVFTWGKMQNGRLGFGGRRKGIEIKGKNDCSTGIVWSPMLLPMDALAVEGSTRQHFVEEDGEILCRDSTNLNSQRPLRDSSESTSGCWDESMLAEKACAGLDSTVFIMRSGAVTSCGKMSGRLGQGEVLGDVYVPRPMIGGLRLWQNKDRGND